MTGKFLKVGVCFFVLTGVVALDAVAWGTRTQRAVTATALQVIRRTYPDAFKTEGQSYDEDVLKGAADGAAGLAVKNKSFSSEAEAISTVDTEIRLLREVRKMGVGSFFSYHMGMLAALSADLMMPLGFMEQSDTASIRKEMEADVDANLNRYVFAPTKRDREFVRSMDEYLQTRRTFISENRQMIIDDYRRGRGYQGFLNEGGQVYFGRATEVVADVWNTVLKVKSDYAEVPPSPTVLTWYLVDEIGYLLKVKKNYFQAVKAYDDFEKVNPGIIEAYEKIGDMFYDFGSDEAKERGVKEWRIAYDRAGTDRRGVGKKLATHYLTIGEALYVKGSKPGAADDDLPNALNAFTQALEFDQTNPKAGQRINETNTAITERRERRQLNVNLLASAEKVKVQAEKKRLEKDYSNAIATYKQASGLFEAVNDEFEDQANAAKDSIKEINKSITDVINEVLDAGNDAISQGDKAVDEKRFDDAIREYQKVDHIVSVIPGDETTTHGKDKRELVELSKKKVEDAKLAQNKWIEMQRQQQEAAKAAARGR